MKRNYYKTYIKWMSNGGIMSHDGLCDAFPEDKFLSLLTPLTTDEFPFYTQSKDICRAYWAANGECTGWRDVYKFTPLRQNIVLLMAAMNNQLTNI